MTRREFIRNSTLAAAGLAFAPHISRADKVTFPVVRVTEVKRRFQSAAVEKTIAKVQSSIGNK